MRLGYACINTLFQDEDKPAKKRLYVNRTCTAKTLKTKGIKYAIELARSNLENVLKVLKWNEDNNIRLYRLSSNMFPHLTNPAFIEEPNNFAYNLDIFDDLFSKIGIYAKEHNHRLTFHPGQYNQIGAINSEVFKKTKCDLMAHAEILDRMNCDYNSILVVHGGGSYGDKQKTIERWSLQFNSLPENVKNRIVIENCERQYNYKDMLYLSSIIDRPVIFDTHHHDCYSKVIEQLPNPSSFIKDIIKTWTKHNLIPKIHISEQAPNKRIGAHSDYVENIPPYILNLIKKEKINIDIMIEAKAKEQAVLYLQEKYNF